MTTKTKVAKSDKWLDMARMHSKNVRPELETILSTTTMAYGTDGYRAHMVKGQYTATNHDSPKLIAGLERQFTLAHDAKCQVTVNVAELAQAAKGAQAFNRDDEGKRIDGFNLRLKATAGGLHLSAKSMEIGDWQTELDATHTGTDQEMAVNPKYLLDALAGMGDTATIRLRPDMLNVVSLDGQREAVVMGMYLGR